MARHLLYIAYFYPPAGGAGVQRSLKFTKYLPRHGWRCHVLTVRDGCYFAHDASLVQEIPPSTEVVRTFSLEAERLAWLRRRRRTHSLGTRPQAGRSLRLLQSWRGLLLPDAQIGWLPFALHAAQRLWRRQRMDAMLTTSSPYSAHLIGLLVHAVTGVPWVADFRDAWSDDPMGILQHHRVHAALEKQVLRHANHVVGVTQDLVETFRQRVPGAACTVIPNGYDGADFATPELPPQRWPWQLTFAGSIYGKISAVPFLTGLARFLAATPAASGKVQVTFYGQMDHRAADDYDAALRRLQLARSCCRRGYVDHATAVRALRQAHVLLLPLYAAPHAQGVMSGKLPEYLAARKPILAMVDAGAAADLVRTAGAGHVVEPTDAAGIAGALEAMWQDHLRGQPAVPDAAVVEAFSREHLTQQLAQLLDTLVLPA